MSNEHMALMLQMLGLIVVGVFAWHSERRNKAYIFAIVFMFIVNLVGQVELKWQGPGGVAGIFVLPVCGFLVAWVCFCMSPKRLANVITMTTTKYSVVMERIFSEYNEKVDIIIDGCYYTQKDIPDILEWWCRNKRIKNTRDFCLRRNGVDLFGFHDTAKEIWVAESEREFVEKLVEEEIVRVDKKSEKLEERS